MTRFVPDPNAPQTAQASSSRGYPTSLGALLAGTRARAAELGGIVVDREQWRNVAGDRTAARTEPGTLRGDTLTIFVASAAWANELSLLSVELLERLQRLDARIQQLHFCVREVAAPEKRASAHLPCRGSEPLPRDLHERLAKLTDPDLRAVITDTASLWLARERAASARRRRPGG